MIAYTLRCFVALLGWSVACAVAAQRGQTWSLRAAFGEPTIQDVYAGESGSLPDDRGNVYYLDADYFLTPRFALTGGLYLERRFFMESVVKTGALNRTAAGIAGGGRFYFFPRKWCVQPYIGGKLLLNPFGLRERSGRYLVQETYSGDSGWLTYRRQQAFGSFAPLLGVDIYLLRSMAFTVEYAYFFAFNGHNQATFTSQNGWRYALEDRNDRTWVTIGLKIDFPVRASSDRTLRNWSNVLELLLENIVRNNLND